MGLGGTKRGRCWLAGAGAWAACFCILPAAAQDLIMRRNQTSIAALVLVANDTLVSYREWADPTGPVTALSPAYVQYVRYQDGRRKDYAAVPTPLEPLEGPNAWPVNTGRNAVSIRPVDMVFTNLTITYERFLGKNRQSGLKVPVSISLDQHTPMFYRKNSIGYYQTNKLFSTGLELNFYAQPSKGVTYFFGPAFQYGRFRYRYGVEYLGEADFFGLELGSVYRTDESVAEHYGFVLNNGINWQVGKRFLITADLGIGFRNNVLDKTRSNLAMEELAGGGLKATSNFSFGYRF